MPPCLAFRGMTKWLVRLAPVVGLFLLSPFCAELLSAYQGPIVNPLDLLIGLALVGPLYGTVAILIREVARRTGRGWPTMLLLSAAFGLVQAGLIDQTLFLHESFEGSPYWERLPTFIPALGVDAGQLLSFVVGHVIWSFAAPIAVVEACVPRRADRPWLGRVGLVTTVVLYLAAAAFFVYELVIAPGFRAEPAELIGAAAVVLVLCVVAFAIPRRSAPASGWVPHPLLVGGAAFLVAFLENWVSSWAGVAAYVVGLAGLGVLLLRWSTRDGWTRVHVLAAAGGALLIRALMAYLTPPLGASMLAKVTSSTVVLLGLLGLLVWAWCRIRRSAETGTEPA